MSDATITAGEVDWAVPPGTTPDGLRVAAEEFLYYEAELLDQWRLDEWLALFTPDGRYIVPATDLPDGDPTRDLVLIHDDRFMLEQRVASLQSRSAHAEYPHSRTRRIVGNVRAVPLGDSYIGIAANFAVYRIRSGTTDCYVGRYTHRLQRDGASFRFVERRAVIELDTLRPHGKVSIIL